MVSSLIVYIITLCTCLFMTPTIYMTYQSHLGVCTNITYQVTEVGQAHLLLPFSIMTKLL